MFRLARLGVVEDVLVNGSSSVRLNDVNEMVVGASCRVRLVNRGGGCRLGACSKQSLRL